MLSIDKVKHYKKFGILDDQYGICFPKLKVTYVREYYQVKDVRITIDKNILYKEYLSEFTHNDNDIIVELKTSIKKNLDDLINYFPIQKSRFSKYCNGIDILNN